MPTATPQNVAEVRVLLPADAETHGWDDVEIAARWTGGLASTIRDYWYERTSDTAGYLDVPDPGGTLPITQIHAQAKAMLEYWDAWLKLYGDVATLEEYYLLTGYGRRVRFGKIKNRYPKPRTMPVPVGPDPNSPYPPTG
jgi:hypothetical protein